MLPPFSSHHSGTLSLCSSVGVCKARVGRFARTRSSDDDDDGESLGCRRCYPRLHTLIQYEICLASPRLLTPLSRISAPNHSPHLLGRQSLLFSTHTDGMSLLTDRE